jgi:hypothetical protein
MQLRSSAGSVAGLLTLCLAAAGPAAAAPVTVELRIEGPSHTLFEGPVTTDVRTFRFTDPPDEHRCDGTAANQGPSASPVPTRGAAIAEAAERTPFSTSGQWFDSLGSPSFSEIAGESVAFDPATNRFLAEFKNDQFASRGSCADPIQAGDEVLFAYTDGSEPLLSLAGPAGARPGEAVSVTVSDASTGAAVPGATVGESTTADDGTALVGPYGDRGDHDLKATKPGSVRSNRLRVCVSDGADGFCGTTAPGTPAPPPPAAAAPDTTAPLGRIASIRDGRRFARRSAPRELAGTVAADPSGLRTVKLSLTRNVRGNCSYYSPRKERFRRTSCGRRVNFAIGDAPEWSYLLPHRLGRGRYVLDVVAVDRAGNRDRRARGRSRVVFFVR